MNRTITTSTTRRQCLRQSLRQCLRHSLRQYLRPAALALITLLALVAASCTADPLADPDATNPAGNGTTNPDGIITFAIAPRPGFTEVPVSGDGTASADAPATRSIPATRAEQTDNATRWEQGDILWLEIDFFRDKKGSGTTTDAYRTSALKYDVDKWRYLTEAEAEDLNTGNIPNFTRLLRWPRESADWPAPVMFIAAYYAGSGKPDADGTLTINPKGEIPTTPLIAGRSGACSPDVQPVPLEFMYEYISRVRIPAGCKVELINAEYWSMISFSIDKGGSVNPEQITEIPAQLEDTDVFLTLGRGGSDNPTAKLTRDNVSYTFTFPTITDEYGNPTCNGASYTLTPYTSGTQSPVADYDLTIATEDQLRDLAQAVNAGEKLPNGKPAAEARVLQTENIELTKEWVPIGNRKYIFCGAYNGNGKTITGLTITKAPQPTDGGDSFVGLFGRADGAVLTGINLREVEINIPQGSGISRLFVGSIVGHIRNSTLSLCSADGTMNADGSVSTVYAGGIAGFSSSYSTISRCRAEVETKAATTLADGAAYAGGIAGSNINCSFILSCETQGRAVTAEGVQQALAGGITGSNDITALIAFCRTDETTVTARNATINNRAGGLVGLNHGYLYSCYSRATAEVPDGTGDKQAGAIAGFNNTPDRVQHCYATGAADKGTSNLNPSDGNIVYNTNPGTGDIFRVISGYTGEVKSLDEPNTGKICYPFTTPYDPSATPAYGIIPRRTVWTSDGAWNQGDGNYPALNIEEYEGRD